MEKSLSSVHKIVPLTRRPDLKAQVEALHQRPADAEHPFAWPRFEFESAAARRYWTDRLLTEFPNFQVVLLSDDETRAVASGHSIPFSWDGDPNELPEGWDDVLDRGFADKRAGRPLTHVSGLAIVISPEAQSKRLSLPMIDAVKQNARNLGFPNIVGPLRPMLKSRYPLATIDDYIRWVNEDGEPFDPWLRTHLKRGAEILRTAPHSLTVKGSVAEWEEWTGMKFPVSGQYVVPHALAPIEIDRERDEGVYYQPNVWIRHPL
jgi:hypothetical protein